jgi:hypothetical protein
MAFPLVRPRESRRLVNTCWLFSFVIALCGLFFSRSLILWVGCVVCLPLALELAGGRKIKPIVAAVVGLFWLPIFLSIVTADLNSQSLDPAAWESIAIFNSLLALFAIAIGYRIGARFFNDLSSHQHDVRLDTKKLLIAYWCAFWLTTSLTVIASFVPSFTQGILAIKGIELFLLYLLAAQIFALNQHYAWLLMAVIAELALGATGYIATYQIPLILVLAAAINTSVQLRFRQIAFAAVLAVSLFWMSLIWTAIKPEYRFWLEFGDPHVTEQTGERIQWIVDKISSGSINYADAVVGFVDRIGYTHFYAVALPRMESGSYPTTSYWIEAVQNLLKPRFLFPDKPPLDDTKITSELTGIQFGPTVSVSTGFVAQAHSDFGFPLMYAPLTLVGVLLGSIGSYFQSGKASVFARDGFMAAALVEKFAYSFNVDKAIGGLLLSTLALLATYWLLYPIFERWATKATY